jgi:DNA recombination protein RmuC
MTLELPGRESLLWLGAGLLIGLLIGALVAYIVSRRARMQRLLLEQHIKHQALLDAERERALALASEQLGSRFGQLASEQLRSHSETFLKLAKESLGAHHERAKGELSAREVAIESLVRPIQEALKKTETRLEQLDKSGRETHGSIKAQLQAMTAGQNTLTQETRNLVNALRRPEVRGQWGEITLKRLVELAGMVEHCDFSPQSHRATEGGSIRPDMLIHLPENRLLVVDVKTPLDAYLEATEAEHPEQRNVALKRHAQIVASRIRELASKSYWEQFEQSPDFVILFIPGDQFLSAALTQRPELLDDALRQNIILATPTSLVALLKAVAYGWQQVTLAENAAEIRALTTFTKHLAGMGKALSDSVKAYNKGVGSLERMVLPSARRFTELGMQAKQELPSLQPIEEAARDVAATDTEVEPQDTPTSPTEGLAH